MNEYVLNANLNSIIDNNWDEMVRINNKIQIDEFIERSEIDKQSIPAMMKEEMEIDHLIDNNINIEE